MAAMGETAPAAMAAAGRQAPVSPVHAKAEATIRVAIGATEVTEGIAVTGGAAAENASSATAGGIGDIVGADVAAVVLSPAEESGGEAAVGAPVAISRSRHTHL
jgi:hypothetical protein